MTVDLRAIRDMVVTHALESGYFERVNTHEPKNSPGNGISAAIWVRSLGPVKTSGLAQTSGLLVFNIRVTNNMLAEPQDEIDANLLDAVSGLMNLYSGDFELGGNVRNVDLLGMAGVPMSMETGYLNQDGKMLRAMVITLPLIVNDVWSQVA